MPHASLIIHPSPSSPLSSRDTEPKPPHTIPILLYRALTFFLRIGAIAKEHAFVSRGFFVFAYAAGLINRFSLVVFGSTGDRGRVVGFGDWGEESKEGGEAGRYLYCGGGLAG